ncbi:MAG: MOSC domain-containing protein, partial [Pseudomonadota bacterium]
DPEQELRRMFARGDDLPLPDLAALPPELAEFESPPGTYFDAYPILIATRTSLEAMQEAHAERKPETVIDMRRFRPNLVLDDVLADGVLETSWSGRWLAIGDCVLKLEIPCPRCIMTTLPFDGLDKDPSIMRTLVQAFEGNFGVYASIEMSGSVRIGDDAKLL